MGQSPHHSLSFSTEQTPLFQCVVKILTAVDSTNRNLMTFLVYFSDSVQGFQSDSSCPFFFFPLYNISCIKIGHGECTTDWPAITGVLKEGQQRLLGVMTLLCSDIIHFIATSTDVAIPRYFIFPVENCLLHPLLTSLDLLSTELFSAVASALVKLTETEGGSLKLHSVKYVSSKLFSGKSSAIKSKWSKQFKIIARLDLLWICSKKQEWRGLLMWG